MRRNAFQQIRAVVEQVLRKHGVPLTPRSSVVFAQRSTAPAPAPESPTTEPQILSPELLSGGLVVATDPPTFEIIVNPLEGITEGLKVRTEIPRSLTIAGPFPGTFYVYINQDAVIRADPQYPSDHTLILAIIRVPYEDPIHIQDDEPDADLVTPVGWIEPWDEQTSTGDFWIDAHSPALQNAIKEIAAEAIIGELVLTEFLKVVNAAGTVKLDPGGLTISDDAGELARLTDEGLYFFEQGTRNELARFGGSGARIGSIAITPNTLESTSFVSQVSGFQIRSDGNVEFGEGFFRGNLVVPALRTATYESGDRTFRFMRRRHLVQNVTVSHGDVFQLNSGSNGPNTLPVDSQGYAVPDFETQPVVFLQENLVPVYNSSFMSGNVTIYRKLMGRVVQSGNSPRWNALQIEAQFLQSGSAGIDTVRERESYPINGVGLGWKLTKGDGQFLSEFDQGFDTGVTEIFAVTGTTFVNEFSVPTGAYSLDAFYYPTSGTYNGASGNQLIFDIRQACYIANSGTPAATRLTYLILENTYYIWIGKSGQPFDISDGITPITGTGYMSFAPWNTLNYFYYNNFQVTADVPAGPNWAFKIDHVKQKLVYTAPAGADLTRINNRWLPTYRSGSEIQFLDRVTYRLTSGSVREITGALVDIEFTED